MVGPSNGAALQLDRALAGLARAGRGAERAGRLRQDPPGAYLGGARRRADRAPPPSCDRRSRCSSSPEAARGRGCDAGRRFRRRRSSISSTGRARRRRACSSRRAAAPADWRVGLPDLRSRLRMATPVALGEPDDELLRKVLVKLFADRQLVVEKAVIDYLLVRMERSLARRGCDRSRRSTGRRSPPAAASPGRWRPESLSREAGASRRSSLNRNRLSSY